MYFLVHNFVNFGFTGSAHEEIFHKRDFTRVALLVVSTQVYFL